MFSCQSSNISLILQSIFDPMIDNPLFTATSNNIEKYKGYENSYKYKLNNKAKQCRKCEEPDSWAIESHKRTISVISDLCFRIGIIRNRKTRTIESAPKWFFQIKIPIRNFTSENWILSSLLSIFDAKEITSYDRNIGVDRNVTNIFYLRM